MTSEQATKRVARGAALLDEKRPGWAAAIADTDIVMSDCFSCVLGRVFGGYPRGLTALALPHHGPEDRWTAAEACGFFVEGNPGPDEEAEYAPLLEAWRAAIEERLSPPVTWTHREKTHRVTP